jgi:hypothetical protein
VLSVVREDLAVPPDLTLELARRNGPTRVGHRLDETAVCPQDTPVGPKRAPFPAAVLQYCRYFR